MEKHPLYQRTYGNLKGVEVEFKEVQGRVRTGIATGVHFLFNPIAPVFLYVANAILARKTGKSRLDKFENGILWLYNGLGLLVAVDVKDAPPMMLDEQRLRLPLKKGLVELRTENSADLQVIFRILNSRETSQAAVVNA